MSATVLAQVIAAAPGGIELALPLSQASEAMSDGEYKESPIFGRTRAANEAEQDAIAAFVSASGLSVFQTLNKALNARGYSLSIATVAARMPSKLRNSPDVVVHALRQFAAQNNLTVDIAHHVFQQQGRFQAQLLTPKIGANGTNQFHCVDLLNNGFVGRVLFLSPYCRESDDDELLKTEYGLACEISAKTLLLSCFPRVELRVPNLLTCAIDSREILA